ncbi:MAG: hypothetical protein HY599_00285 [Candidatus Omnitrophica bacterium]|nr:hypothetical protein [Candidatus Omnitrophota bacterium]
MRRAHDLPLGTLRRRAGRLRLDPAAARRPGRAHILAVAGRTRRGHRGAGAPLLAARGIGQRHLPAGLCRRWVQRLLQGAVPADRRGGHRDDAGVLRPLRPSAARRGVLHAPLHRPAGHARPRLHERPAAALPRCGAVDLLPLHHDRVSEVRRAVHRSGNEVPHHGLGLVGVPGLRLGAALRRHGEHDVCCDPRRTRHPAADARRAGGRAARAGGPGVQDRGGALPLVGAGRVRGRPDAGRGVPVGGLEDGGDRGADPRALRRVPAAAAVLGASPVGPLRGHDVLRQLGRAAADEHQTAAGLLVDRPRGLSADGDFNGIGGRHPSRRLLPAGVPVQQPGGLSRGRGGERGGRRRGAGRLQGLAKRSGVLAASLFIGLLSLAGVPPLAGFVGKLLVLLRTVESQRLWLVAIGAVNVAISLYYYLMIVKRMYLDTPKAASPIPVSRLTKVVLAALVLGIFAAGIWPEPFLQRIIASIH